jgi:hypothetical protein
MNPLKTTCAKRSSSIARGNLPCRCCARHWRRAGVGVPGQGSGQGLGTLDGTWRGAARYGKSPSRPAPRPDTANARTPFADPARAPARVRPEPRRMDPSATSDSCRTACPVRPPAPGITSKKTAAPLLPSLTQLNARLVCSSSCWDKLHPRRGGRSTHGPPRAWPQHRQDVDPGSPRRRRKRHHRRRVPPTGPASADTKGGNGPAPTRRSRWLRPCRRRRGSSGTATVSPSRHKACGGFCPGVPTPGSPDKIPRKST